MNLIKNVLNRVHDSIRNASDSYLNIVCDSLIKLEELAIVKFLLKNGVDTNLLNVEGRTLLHNACYPSNGSSFYQLEVVDLLIHHGADVNVPDKSGSSPLLMAVKGDNIEVCKLLLNKGADINVSNTNGFSVLHMAVYITSKCIGLRLEMLKLLLDRGVCVNITDNEGDSPLHKALKNNQSDLQIIKFFLDNGANVNLLNHSGKSPLLCAAEYCHCRKDVIVLLLKYGASVETRDEFSRSVLHHAVDSPFCTLAVIKVLLNHQADVSAVDYNNNSVLHYAVSACNENALYIVKLLLHNGADINFVNVENQSPLMYFYKRLPIKRDMDKLLPLKRGMVKLLLDNGVRIGTAKECSPSVILQLLERSEIGTFLDTSVECVQLLIKYALFQQNFISEAIIEGCVSNFALYVKLSKFEMNCMKELILMCSETFNNVYEFFRSKQCQNYDINEVLRLLAGNKYPFNREVILSKVSTSSMMDKLEEHWIICQHSIHEKSLILDYDSVCCIVKYLPKDDLFSLIEAFHDNLSYNEKNLD